MTWPSTTAWRVAALLNRIRKANTMTSPQTVRDLVNTLAQCNPDAIVTLGKAPGPLGHITETVNGYVILDCGEPLPPAGTTP